MIAADKATGTIFDHEEMNGIQIGDVLWERVEIDPDLNSQEYRQRQRTYLTRRWTNAALFILTHRPAWRMTWPVIIEGDDAIELKSEIQECS